VRASVWAAWRAKAKLALSERTYTCTTCGLVLNRDENAARNLAALAADVAQSRGETENAPRETGRDGIGRSGGAGVRPTPGGPSALKREPRKRGMPGRKATAAWHVLTHEQMPGNG
jgi:Putative transposase DNA-binding domain